MGTVREEISRAADVVDGWPEWKRNALTGKSDMQATSTSPRFLPFKTKASNPWPHRRGWNGVFDSMTGKVAFFEFVDHRVIAARLNMDERNYFAWVTP